MSNSVTHPDPNMSKGQRKEQTVWKPTRKTINRSVEISKDMSIETLNITGPNCPKTPTTESKQSLNYLLLRDSISHWQRHKQKGQEWNTIYQGNWSRTQAETVILHMTHQRSSQNSSNEIKEITIYDTDHQEDRMAISIHAPSVGTSNSTGKKILYKKITNRSTYNNQGVTSLPPSHQ